MEKIKLAPQDLWEIEKILYKIRLNYIDKDNPTENRKEKYTNAAFIGDDRLKLSSYFRTKFTEDAVRAIMTCINDYIVFHIENMESYMVSIRTLNRIRNNNPSEHELIEAYANHFINPTLINKNLREVADDIKKYFDEKTVNEIITLIKSILNLEVFKSRHIMGSIPTYRHFDQSKRNYF